MIDVETFIANHRVARLATISGQSRPHLVPVVYVYDGSSVFIALDEKPKRVAPLQLQRVRNIQNHPHVSLLVDDYDEDWKHLAWVRLDGIAKILEHGQTHAAAIQMLRDKYPQYRQMNLETSPLIQMTIRRRVSWEATDG